MGWFEVGSDVPQSVPAVGLRSLRIFPPAYVLHPPPTLHAPCCCIACGAVPLARALVHAKVPAWMDEEMPQQAEGQPGGGAPLTANMQRYRWVREEDGGGTKPEGIGPSSSTEFHVSPCLPSPPHPDPPHTHALCPRDTQTLKPTRRDVVSLLVGAPESAGLALAAEVYGPSMGEWAGACVCVCVCARGG